MITREKIDLERIRSDAHQPKAGAMILFCGDIRNHSHGKEVIAVEYDAYPSMAIKQIEKIVDFAKQQWPLEHVQVLHRLGKLEVLECSIVIAVASAHRKDAYQASQYIIDTIKRSVPIWKREYFADGTTEWSQGCQACEVGDHSSLH